MKIKQIRQGFANNSSSTHSIIYTRKINEMSSVSSDGFGWEYFTAADRESKEKYMFSCLISQINEEMLSNTQFYGLRSIGSNVDVNWKNMPYVLKNESKFVLRFGWYRGHDRFNDIVKPIIETFRDAFTNFDYFVKSCESDSYEFSVDHQSLICFPKDSKTGGIHVQFAKDLIKFIVTENFVILGGNDNSDDEHQYSGYNEGHELLGFLSSITENSNYVVVRDEANEDYVVQNKGNGTVYRVSFSNSEETKKSSIPTLVDISITSFCDKGCKFCYQSSSVNGVHADKNRVFEILKSLKSAGTLEIVLGGGEPTSHPDFVEILKFAKNLGFVISFTSRNYNLDSDPDIKDILNNTNSIAFSCNSADDVNSVIQYRERLDGAKIWNHPDMTVQNILGLHSLDQLEEFLKACCSHYNTANVCLLGYKDFGFGKNHSPKSVTGWIDMIKNFNDADWCSENNLNYELSFGIDSIVVKKYKDDLISSGVDYRTLVAEEGKFSCYIDCVKNTISPSSFTDTHHEFNENWLNIYQTF